MTNIFRGVKFNLGSTRFNFKAFIISSFVCIMFYFLKDFDNANYADKSTPYNAKINVEFVVNNLEHSSVIFFNDLTTITWKQILVEVIS